MVIKVAISPVRCINALNDSINTPVKLFPHGRNSPHNNDQLAMDRTHNIQEIGIRISFMTDFADIDVFVVEIEY